MPHDELRKYTTAQPFVPFRIHLTDGRQFEIRHPDLMIVTRHVVYLGVFDPVANVADRVITIAMIHIVSAEPIGQPVAS